MKRLLAALGTLASLLGLAYTANGYRPLAKRGYGSLSAFAYGLLASELPKPSLGAHAVALAAATPHLPPRLRRFTWLTSVLSWVGLLGLHHLGHSADETLTAALDEGLGPDRRKEAGDMWKRPHWRCHGEEARRPSHDADLSRLHPRRKHQLRRVRVAQPPGHLAPA